MTPDIREANMASTFYATKVKHVASVVNSANKAAAKSSKSTKTPSKSKDELIDSARRQFGKTSRF
ncbi:hypothetical protein N9Q19_00055 [Puniceicoccaceae bacterium]|nr:hypothetical protein [Puniceicoccaceae bacterium]